MALVLERKPGQSILIGQHLEVTLERISGKRVTLALTGPNGRGTVRRTLDGPEATFAVGPVRIQARRDPSRSSRSVRLTFEAPRHIQITRRELIERADEQIAA